MNNQMIDPWKSDDKCERCGELMNYRPGESYTASTDGKVWHYGCAPSRPAYNPDERLTTVTDGMREAGQRAFEKEIVGSIRGLDYGPAVTAIYNAMRDAALSPLPQGDDT